MHPALMQDLAATIAADRRREGERARASGAVPARDSRLSRALRWLRPTTAPVPSSELDPAPRESNDERDPSETGRAIGRQLLASRGPVRPDGYRRPGGTS